MAQDQAYAQMQGRAQSAGAGMTPVQRAFLDAQIALSAWRAARDAEAQVAHWLTEGRATREELAEMRRRTRLAHEAHQRAQLTYRRAVGLSETR